MILCCVAKLVLLMFSINAPAKHQLTTHSSHLLIFTYFTFSLLFIYTHHTTPLSSLTHSPNISFFCVFLFLPKQHRIMKLPSLLVWVMVSGLLSQSLVIPVVSIRFDDQKNYYSPTPTDPHTPSPPSGSHHHGSTPSPSHGGGSHGGSPSHGGGSYTPTPSTPSHGGSYTPTPSTPSTPPPSNCGNPPQDPNTPSTPTPSIPTPSTPTPEYHSPPSTPSGGGSPPLIVSPPFFPVVPTPPTPFLPDPNSPPPFSGTCNFWSSHPGMIFGLLGWWGTLGNSINLPSIPGFGSNMSLQQALSNTRSDGYGALYREGTASWLNSMVNHRFPFTTQQVRDRFVAALHSDRSASAQARLFKMANEGRLKPRA